MEQTGSKQVTAQYLWGSFGLLRTVNIKPDTNSGALLTTTMSYDRIGRRTGVNDSNRGNRTSTYNAFDELSTHTDPKLQVTTFLYDDLGRMKDRIAPEGTSHWDYDSALNGLGLLARSTSPDGVVDAITYDSLSRPQAATKQVSGQSFTFNRTYDSLGRLEKILYPETPGWPRLELTNSYRPGTGELIGLTRTDTGAKLWEAQQFDSDGRLTREILGQSIDAHGAPTRSPGG